MNTQYPAFRNRGHAILTALVTSVTLLVSYPPATASFNIVGTYENYTLVDYDLSIVFADPKPSFGISYDVVPDDPDIDWDYDIGYRVRNFQSWSAVVEIYDPERVADPIILDPHKTFLANQLGLSFQIDATNPYFWNDAFLTVGGVQYPVHEGSIQVTNIDEGNSGGPTVDADGNFYWDFDSVSITELAIIELLAGRSVYVEFVPDYMWTAKMIPWLGTCDIVAVTGPEYLLIDPSVAIPEPAQAALLAAISGLGLILLRRRNRAACLLALSVISILFLIPAIRACEPGQIIGFNFDYPPTLIPENQPANSLVGAFDGYAISCEGYIGRAFWWTLIDGEGDDDNHLFSLSESGELRTLYPLDYELKRSYSIRVHRYWYGPHPYSFSDIIHVMTIEDLAELIPATERMAGRSGLSTRADGDHNGNGIPDFMEYLVPPGELLLPVAFTGGTNDYNYLRIWIRTDDPFIHYKFGESTDLAEWTWRPISIVPEPGQPYAVLTVADTTQEFLYPYPLYGYLAVHFSENKPLEKAFYTISADYAFDLTAPLGVVMLPAGEFQMGRPESSPYPWGGDTQHPVELQRPFAIQRTPVTWDQWNVVRDWTLLPANAALGYAIGAGAMGSSPATSAGDHPVTSVTWYDVVKWCNAKSEMEGKMPVYYLDAGHTQIYRSGQHDLTNAWVGWEANGYRLPTEAEWEYACRAGTSTDFFTGNMTAENQDLCSNLDPAGWYYANSGGNTHAVGGKQPNPWGLYDVHGNVWEWVWDFHEDFTIDPQVDPRGPDTGTNRLMRGGSFNNNVQDCRSFRRFPTPPWSSGTYGGFRLAQNVPATS